MNFLLILALIAMIYGIQWLGGQKWNDEYTEIANTHAVSGMFVLLVFMSHVSSYFDLGSGDQIYRYVRMAFSQLIVAPFFFYSGYGVYRSVREKGTAYVKNMPYRRIFRVWLHFAIAICCYWILLKIRGYTINPVKIPLVFLGWYSIGNSNWFIFDILVFYLISWMSFSVFRNNQKAAVWCNLILCILFGLLLYLFFPERRIFYHLILVYPFGMLFGYYQKGMENRIKQRKYSYFIALGTMVVVFLLLELFRRKLIVYEIHGIVFVTIMVLLTMKVKVGNPVLRFLGDHIFEIYIYQRIPMIALKKTALFEHHFLYGLCCFALVLIIAFLVKKAEDWLDRKLRILPIS